MLCVDSQTSPTHLCVGKHTYTITILQINKTTVNFVGPSRKCAIMNSGRNQIRDVLGIDEVRGGDTEGRDNKDVGGNCRE